MYHWIVNTPLQTSVDCFIDDVIGSQNRSKLWTAIALSKFELEKRSNAQNVGNWTGYQKFKFQFHIQISKFWQVRNLRLPFHLFVTCQNYHFGKYVRWSCLFVCLSVCLYGSFTLSQERVSQSSPNLVTSKHWSMIPASSLDKVVGQKTRSRGQKVGQTLKVS